jgi:microcystin-dependent protein
MSDPYVGEIRTVGFNFAPYGWAMCSGQIIPIAQNTALFSLIGTLYGGNGTTTFALPNLNGSFAIGRGDGAGLTPRRVGDQGGLSSVTLSIAEIPAHTHEAAGVAAAGTSGSPDARRWAQPRFGRVAQNAYGTTANTAMASDALGFAGGGEPHENMPPYLAMYFVIALSGVFPPRD